MLTSIRALIKVIQSVTIHTHLAKPTREAKTKFIDNREKYIMIGIYNKATPNQLVVSHPPPLYFHLQFFR